MPSEFHDWWSYHPDLKSVRYFSADELLFRGASDRALGLNTDPPEMLWENIIPTIILCDKIRDIFGYPLRVVSAYRSPAYNRAIGGARFSRHLRFDAVDLAPIHGRISTLKDVSAREISCRGFGGLGFYSWGVHVDSRSGSARW